MLNKKFGVSLLGFLMATASPVLAEDLLKLGDFEVIESNAAAFRIEVVADGMNMPFGLAFLPDGNALVTDRLERSIYLIDFETGGKTEIVGAKDLVTEVEGGAGLLDIVLHPDFEENGWVYISYAEKIEGGWVTTVDRFKILDNQISDHETLFRSSPPLEVVGDHFGGRIQIKDGYLFFSVGDRRQEDRTIAQDLTTHIGKVIRLFDDGSVPDDNPFSGQEGILPEIWTWGHRNPQGLVFHPETGVLWSNEHGPAGGDEVNIIRPARNYGWPFYTYGDEYSGGPVYNGLTHGPGIEQPKYFWKPSIAPSGMEFYTGDAFPKWKSSVFIGALLGFLIRLTVDGERVINEERLLEDKNWRIRFAKQGPDDFLYIGTDEGTVLRLSPAQDKTQ